MLLLYSGYPTKNVRTRTCLTRKFGNLPKRKPAEAGMLLVSDYYPPVQSFLIGSILIVVL